MKLPHRDEIKVWLKGNKIPRQEIADLCGVAKTTVDQWLSKKDIPLAQHTVIARRMLPADQLTDQSRFTLVMSEERYAAAQSAAKTVGSEFHDYCVQAVIARVEQDMRKPVKGTPLSKKMGVARRTNGNGNGNGESKAAS